MIDDEEKPGENRYGPAGKEEPVYVSFDVLAVIRWLKKMFKKEVRVERKEV